MDRRKAIHALLALGLAGGPAAAFGQRKPKVWRIGLVWGGTGGAQEKGFLAGLKDHGYEPGRDVVLDVRYARGDPSRYPALVDEIMALKPDILMGTNTAVALEMKRRTSTIPIVLGTPGDAVGSGLAQSLSRPGGNITGMSLQIHELSAKHLQLIAEVRPRMRRAAVLSDQTNERSITEQYERIARKTAEAMGLSLSVHRVAGGQDPRPAVREAQGRQAEALLVNPSPRFNVMRKEIISAATELRVPVVGFSEDWAQSGALVSFGPSFVEAMRRTAYYVDRIINGAKPGDLPIEQPTKFFLAVNTKVANELGINVPGALLVRVDRVID